MANQHKDIDQDELIRLADEYCEECISKTKEAPTARGAVSFKERNIPTIEFFSMHWLRAKGFDFYTRQHIYKAIKDESHPLCDTLKNIRETFDSLAVDVVANEQKGIFYAKNRLGMTDKNESKNDTTYRLIDDTADSGHKATDTTRSTAESSE